MNVSAVFLASRPSCMPIFPDPRISVEYGGEPTLFEFPTLAKLEAYCQATPSARVIYFHTKGARYKEGDKKVSACSGIFA
jgi:hypothetical protein